MKLEDIFPPQLMSTNPVDLAVYARDASHFEGQCKAVVWPKTFEQIHKLVLYARRTSHHLTIRGAATSRYGGCVPAGSIVVDMSKMNKILEIGSDYVIVEPGVVLDDLNRVLREKKKYFPVVPLEHNVCTIGGMVSTNCYGLDTFYGRMEEWVTQLHVVDGSGKNMTLGAVPSKAFVGAEGSMGVICKIKLKIVQRKQYTTMSIFSFNTLQALWRKFQELNENDKVLSIFYMDELASGFMDLGEGMHLLVTFSDDSGVIHEKEELDKLAELKEMLQHKLVKRRYSEKEDPWIPKHNIPKFLYWLRKNLVPAFGHLKLGILHPCFRDYSKLPEEMYGIVEQLQGKVIGEYAVGIKRKKYVEKELREKLEIFKNQYDHLKIMNRGVLVD